MFLKNQTAGAQGSSSACRDGKPSCPPSPAWDRSVTLPKSRSQHQRSATPKSPIMHLGPAACQGWDVTLLRPGENSRAPLCPQEMLVCCSSRSPSPGHQPRHAHVSKARLRPPRAPGTGPPWPHTTPPLGQPQGNRADRCGPQSLTPVLVPATCWERTSHHGQHRRLLEHSTWGVLLPR